MPPIAHGARSRRRTAPLLALLAAVGCHGAGPPPLPSITSIKPQTGPADVATTIEIGGTDLAPGGDTPRVFVDDVECGQVSLAGGSVRATVPAGLFPGARDVRVLTGSSLVARRQGGYTVGPPARAVPMVIVEAPVDGQVVEPGATVAVRVLARSSTARVSRIDVDVSGATTAQLVQDVAPALTGAAGEFRLAIPSSAQPGETVKLQARALDDQAHPVEGDAPLVSLVVARTQPPRIAAVVPPRGSDGGGAAIEIHGDGFAPGSVVLVGGTPLANIAVVSSTQINGTTTAHADGKGDVTVTGLTGDATLAGGYEWKAGPVVSRVTPPIGVSSGGTRITVEGAGFGADAQVLVNGVAATDVSREDDGTILCSTPAGDDGPADVTVLTGSAADTLLAAFHYLPQPVIGGIDPAMGLTSGGSALTLTGEGFAAFPGYTTAVALGGQPLTGVYVLDAHTLTGFTPAGTGAVDVSLQTAEGSALLPSSYTYLPAPAITTVSPPLGPQAGGTVLAIGGAGFIDVQAVRLGASNLVGLVVDGPTSIHGVVPPGQGMADVAVITRYGSVTAPGAFTYAPPQQINIAELSPSTLPADGSSHAMIVVQVTDAFGVGAANEPVAISASAGTVSPVTDRGNGSYTAFLTAPASIGSGSVTVIATDPRASHQTSDSATIQLVPGPLTRLSWLSLTPSRLWADGHSQAVGVVAPVDANGNPIDGAAISFATGAGATISSSASLGGGRYQVVVTAPPQVPPGGLVTVTASIGPVLAPTTIAVPSGPPTSLAIETAADGSGQAVGPLALGAGQSVTLFAVSRDAGGRFVEDEPVTWSMSAPVGQLSQTVAGSATLLATTVGSGVIGAQPGHNLPAASTGLVTVAAGPLAAYSVSAPFAAEVGTPTNVTVAAVDAYGNALTGATSALALTDASGAVTPTVTPTLVAGAATFAVTFGKPIAGDVLQVEDGVGHGGQSARFDVALDLPSVTSIAPASGLTSGGLPVTIRGAGFRTTDTATIGGQPLGNAHVVDAQTITGLTPTGVAGPADVSVVRASYPQTLAGAFTFADTQTFTITAGPSGWSDTTLRSEPGATGWNFGADPVIGVAAVDATSGAAADVDRAIVSFDVQGAMPPNARVVDAALQLYGTTHGWSTLAPLTIANARATTLPAGVPVAVTWNHAAAVSAGLASATGDDVHLLFQSGGGAWREIERVVDAGSRWNQPTTTLWLQTQAPIAANGSDGTSYAIGYGLVAAPPHPPAPDQVFAPGPGANVVAIYHCEDGAGTRLHDSSGNGNDATLTAFAQGAWGAGAQSGGLLLDGHGYATANVPLPSGDFTVEGWFKTAKSGGIAGWAQMAPTGGPSIVELAVNNGRLTGRIADSAFGNLQIADNGPPSNDNAWHHAALVLGSGTRGFPGALTLFRDGQIVAQANATGVATSNGFTFVVGGGGGSQLLVGAVDDVAVSDFAKTGFPYVGAAPSGSAGAGAPNAVARGLVAYRLLQSSTEGTGAPSTGAVVSAPACWNTRAPNTRWMAAGADAASDTQGDGGTADRSATPFAGVTVTSPAAFYALDVTFAASRWANGTWAENGLLLASATGASDFSHVAFASREATDSTTRPRLQITVAADRSPVWVDVPAAAATTLDAASPKTNESSAATLAVSSSGGGLAQRTLLRFDVGDMVPAGKTIVTAELHLTEVSQVTGTPAVFSAWELARPFTTSGATWLATGSGGWAAPGASGVGSDRAPQAVTSAATSPAVGSVVVVNLAGSATRWLAQPGSNDGVVLQLDDESVAAGAAFAAPGQANGPTLRVAYLP